MSITSLNANVTSGDIEVEKLYSPFIYASKEQCQKDASVKVEMSLRAVKAECIQKEVNLSVSK